jgi:hypothetical protein
MYCEFVIHQIACNVLWYIKLHAMYCDISHLMQYIVIHDTSLRIQKVGNTSHLRWQDNIYRMQCFLAPYQKSREL